MAYNTLGYFALFVPAVILVYSLVPSRYRWMVLLAADYIFFWIWSKFLVLYNIGCAAVTCLFGRKLESMRKTPKGEDRKKFKKKKKRILALGILCNLGVLAILKYTNFFGEAIAGSKWTALNILVPVGISYYTLQAVSYLSDVVSGKIHAQENPFRLALYLSFFPILVEGPIARYGDLSEDLYAGHDITYINLTQGYQRILWGVFKKIAISDYLAIAVDKIFASYTHVGSLCLFGAVLYTIQLYTDFSGTIDIVIGTGKIFGITIPENFRQPFFAKNAGDFWRRWHITLGAFFRDYIFYPVSLSQPIQKLSKWTKNHIGKYPARMIGPVIALFLVWISNGLWHGASWTYILYGIYYFLLMAFEMFTKAPFERLYAKLHISEDSKGLAVMRFFKMLVIIISGETLFRADSLSVFLTMYRNIFTNFNFAEFKTTYTMLGLGRLEYLVAAFGFLIVVIVDVLKEKGISVRKPIEKMPAPVRWAFWYAAVLYIVFFGAYGPGFDAAAMMYAGF